MSPWLGQVKPVDSLEQALALRGQLAVGESLISRDGYWVGRHFLRVRRASEAESGVLARGQEIEQLQLDREALEETLATLETQLQTLRATQRQQETGRAGRGPPAGRTESQAVRRQGQGRTTATAPYPAR